jgi:predicted phage-related endonuclease
MTQKFPDRHKYLGPSEAAIACGLSSYHDPIELWEIKTLRRARPETTPVMERGNMMEPIIIERLYKEHGIVVRDQQLELTCEDHPYLIGHCDGIIEDYHYIGNGEPLDENECEGPGICEVKAPGANMCAKFNREGLTPDYIMQAQLYMHMAGLKWASVFYLNYESNVIEQIDLTYSPDFIMSVLAVLHTFWKYVEADEPPSSTTPPLSIPGPDSGLEEIDDDELMAMLLEALAMKDEADALKEQVDEALKQRMLKLECDEAILNGTWKITWKERVTTRVDARGLHQWTNALVDAVVNGREEEVNKMCQNWCVDPDGMLMKRSVSRPLTKRTIKQ